MSPAANQLKGLSWLREDALTPLHEPHGRPVVPGAAGRAGEVADHRERVARGLRLALLRGSK
jgi:hypothetical protein